MSSYDVIIIGAGVVGNSIALSLSRAGLRTINVDALPAPGYGSTSHSSAIVRPFYSHLSAAAIAHEARHRWLSWGDFLQLPAHMPLAQYTESGGTVLYNESQFSDYEANLAALDAAGVDYVLLSQSQLRQQFPGIDLSGYGPPKRIADATFGQSNRCPITGGIYIPACGYVNDPQLAAHNLYSAANSCGAQFAFGAAVNAITNVQGCYQITLGNGEAHVANALVNAAGPHSGVINGMAGVTLPIATAPHRHEVAYVKSPFPGAKDAGFLVDMDNGFYQRSDGNDLLVGTVDPACDPVQVVAPDDSNTAFSEQWTHQVYRAGLRFPEIGIESQARGTVGIYDVSDDWIPLYDKTDLPGYFVAIGTSGNQFKNAPLIGDLMYQIICHPGDHDIDPAHLSLEQVGLNIDLSFYSRLRKPRTTASVLA